MTDATHECPGGCGSQVARRLLACKPCWLRLPKPQRDAINSAHLHRQADPRAHRQAMRAAFTWYRDNPPGGTQ